MLCIHDRSNLAQCLEASDHHESDGRLAGRFRSDDFNDSATRSSTAAQHLVIERYDPRGDRRDGDVDAVAHPYQTMLRPPVLVALSRDQFQVLQSILHRPDFLLRHWDHC